MVPMSNPGDNGSWNTQGNGHDASSGQDPWAQPPADPYGQQGASEQPPAADPFAQQPGSAPSAADPYGQSEQSWSPAASGGSASEAYGQPAPGAAPAGQGAYAQQPGAAGAPAGEAPSRLLVGLMGIFFGYLGVHRFLMGYTTIGIIQIVVTVVTCGFGGLWGFVEGIMVLAKSESFLRDAHGRPLTD